VRRLVHLAKYRAVQELDNFDANSPLKGELKVELAGVQEDYDAADRPEPKPFADPAGVPTLKVGWWTFLRIRNDSSQVLNIAVLDLQPDWGISQVFPRRQDLFFEPLDPGKELPLIPLRGDLPDGYSVGRDTLKVLATVGAANFRVLELPRLDQPSQGRAARHGTRSVARSPLDELLATAAADRPPTRTLTPASSPSEEWTVAQLEVCIRR